MSEKGKVLTYYLLSKKEKKGRILTRPSYITTDSDKLLELHKVYRSFYRQHGLLLNQNDDLQIQHLNQLHFQNVHGCLRHQAHCLCNEIFAATVFC